jgi:hypothetical protein
MRGVRKMVKIKKRAKSLGFKKFLFKGLALYVLLSFLAPSLLKLEHHHEHFVCNAKTEHHFHNAHPKCEICEFEFSLFSNDHPDVVFDFYSPFVVPAFIFEQKVDVLDPVYSFLLRAPPAFLV